MADDLDDEVVEEEGEGDLIGSYEGERNDKEQRHGFGKATLPNGDVYEGQYLNGKRNGLGSYKFKASKAKYEGTYYQNKRHGIGEFFYPDGSKYEGEWARNKRHGRGTYTYINGDSYVGEWNMNKRAGMGVYTFAGRSGAPPGSQVKYAGLWKNGKRHGYGEVFYPDVKYRGRFKFDVPRGRGRFLFDKIDVQTEGDAVLVGPNEDALLENAGEEEQEVIDEEEGQEMRPKFKVNTISKLMRYLEPWEIEEKNKYVALKATVSDHLPDIPGLSSASMVDMFTVEKAFSDCSDDFQHAEQIVKEVLLNAEVRVMDIQTSSLENITRVEERPASAK